MCVLGATVGMNGKCVDESGDRKNGAQRQTVEVASDRYGDGVESPESREGLCATAQIEESSDLRNPRFHDGHEDGVNQRVAEPASGTGGGESGCQVGMADVDDGNDRSETGK